MNKQGDERGCKENNAQNFANNPELASKAGSSKKTTSGLTQAITKSNVISQGRRSRITPEIQQLIRDELTKKDKKGTPYIHSFIEAFLKEAKSDLNSAPARLLAAAMFKDDLMTTLDAELNKQMTKDYEFLVYRIRNTLYDKQQEVFDNNIDSTMQAICTRRAGKTELLARLSLKDAMKPNHHVLYVNRTFDNAVKQMGKPLTDLLDKLDITYSGSPGGGMVKFDNGSDITFGGFYNKGEIDKFRGYKYSLVLVDEIGHLRNPKMLVQEVLEPAMMDYGKEAQLIYTGTPPRIKKSFAYELWHNPAIKHYHWSFMDNPFIPDKEGAIEKVCKEHGLPVEAPFIQREYFGNMEAFDEDAMIFRGYKKVDKLPDRTWTHAWVGVDWGYEDKAAVISIVADQTKKEAYITKSWAEPHKSISEICEVVKAQLAELSQLRISRPVQVICDTNEKSAVYELYQTYKIQNAFCAYKYDKDLAIDQLAEWLRNDTIFVVEKDNTAIIEDLDNMLWARDEETDEITHEVADDEYHGNAAFALLYASRQFAFDVMGQTDVKSAKHILENRND